MLKTTVLCILLSLLYVRIGETLLNSTDVEEKQKPEGGHEDHVELKPSRHQASLSKRGGEKKFHGPLDKHSPHNDSPFKFHPEKLGWSDANQLCIKEKGYLATAMTLDEAKVMVTILESQSQAIENVYAGFQDILKHGEFVDASGHELPSGGYVMTFLDSSSGPNKHCGVMHVGGHFSLEACDKPLPFFCRRPKSLSTHASLAARIKNSHIVRFFKRIFV